MEAATVASYSFTFNPLVFLAIAAIIFSKSFRNFVEDWGFVFMVLSIHFYGFIGWLLLWAFYEYVVFLTEDKKPKKKKSKKSKKSMEINNDKFLEDFEKTNREKLVKTKKYI
jgi:hypothetical protein